MSLSVCAAEQSKHFRRSRPMHRRSGCRRQSMLEFHHEELMDPSSRSQDSVPSASAMSDAQRLISSQSRKSPSATRRAAVIAFSGKLSCLFTSLPANTRWSRAFVLLRISETSTGSSAGFAGSPTGPLENSHTGREARASADLSTSSLALEPLARIDRASEHDRVVVFDPVDLVGRGHRGVEALLSELVPNGLGDLPRCSVFGGCRDEHFHRMLHSLSPSSAQTDHWANERGHGAVDGLSPCV